MAVATNYVTEHIALVAVLQMEGIEPVSKAWDQGFCRWHFDDTDALQECVERFEAGNMFVEVKRFVRAFTSVKQDMYRDQRRAKRG